MTSDWHAKNLFSSLHRFKNYSPLRPVRPLLLLFSAFSVHIRSVVKPGHYSVLRSHILRVLLTLFGEMT